MQVLGESCFKAAKVPFERSQFQRVGVALSEFYLVVLPSLRVLGESCFKASKVSAGRIFLPLKCLLLLFLYKNRPSVITVSEGGCGRFSVSMNLFSLLRVLGKKYYLMKFLGKYETYIFFLSISNLWNLLS